MWRVRFKEQSKRKPKSVGKCAKVIILIDDDNGFPMVKRLLGIQTG